MLSTTLYTIQSKKVRIMYIFDIGDIFSKPIFFLKPFIFLTNHSEGSMFLRNSRVSCHGEIKHISSHSIAG